MYDRRSIFVLLAYVLFCSALIFKSLREQDTVQTNKQNQEIAKVSHKFKNVTYYQLESENRRAHLNSIYLEASPELISAQEPRGHVYDSTKKKIYFQSDKARYLKKKSMIYLVGNVDMKNSMAQVKCAKSQLSIAKQIAHCETDVKTQITELENGDKVYISSNKLKMQLESKVLNFSGKVRGRVKRKFSYEPGIKFSSEKLKINSEDLKAELEEDVRFDFEGVKSSSGRAELFLDNYNKKLKYYVLYDDIEIEQKIESQEGETFIRRAYSEVVEAFNLERKIVLKGAPKVSQGGDMTRGYKITLFLDREIMEVENSSSVIKIKQ